MKKLTLFVAGLAFIAATTTSCKKESSCTCSYTIFGVTSSATANYEKANKKDRDKLKAACESSSFCKYEVK